MDVVLRDKHGRRLGPCSHCLAYGPLLAGLCQTHYWRKNRGKDLDAWSRLGPQKYVVKKNHVEVMVFHKGTFLPFLVDKKDFPLVKNYRWSYKTGYAENVKTKTFLHHLIIGRPPAGLMVDHKNRNRADNRRKNLRFLTNAENMLNGNLRKDNRSGVVGVSWVEKQKRWHARIKKDGIAVYLGSFKKKKDAVAVRSKTEKELFGGLIYHRENELTDLQYAPAI